MEHGDTPGESQKEPREDMGFILDSLLAKKEEKEENPLWFSDSSAPSDWFYSDE